jgi:uncharacterized protein
MLPQPGPARTPRSGSPDSHPDLEAAPVAAGRLPAQLLVLAKEPLAGLVKTRLSPALTPGQAAAVARAALRDTLAAVAGVLVLRCTVVLDGSPVYCVPPGFAVLPQRAGSLNERLDGAFQDAHRALPVPMLLLGMDTPQVSGTLLTAAVQQLLAPGAAAVLGETDDGGWWALGLHRPLAGAFDGVPMSTDRAGAVQRQRLAALGAPPSALPRLRDIDLLEDLVAVAATMPASTHLARLTASLRPASA